MNKTFLKLFIMHSFSTEIIEIEWLMAQTCSGEFLILPGHQALLSSLSDGESVEFKTRLGDVKKINNSGSILKIDGDGSLFIFC